MQLTFFLEAISLKHAHRLELGGLGRTIRGAIGT
jgi:hypothetical protein